MTLISILAILLLGADVGAFIVAVLIVAALVAAVPAIRARMGSLGPTRRPEDDDEAR